MDIIFANMGAFLLVLLVFMAELSYESIRLKWVIPRFEKSSGANTRAALRLLNNHSNN
jgi:hypothetical protein